jgi:RNA 3'-terminal phosphate cyclase (ATP)
VLAVKQRWKKDKRRPTLSSIEPAAKTVSSSKLPAISFGERPRMLEIDGSEHSGSGTIVRDAVPFCILTGQEIHLRNIRAKRDKPGLRPQHLKALEAAAALCGGGLTGGTVGSREIRFHPGRAIKGGTFVWDIGTAGSTVMMALSLMPLGLFAESASIYRMTGGLFQDFAPSLFHLKHVLLPTVRKMGVQAEVRIIQPGYVPKGGGRIEVQIVPVKETLKRLDLVSKGQVRSIKGIALASHLKERDVSRRMGRKCERALKERGFDPEIQLLHDERESPAFEGPSIQPGAALAIWAETDAGCLIGADMAGARGRTAEFIGKQTASDLLADLGSAATVDRHLADQVIPFAALAEGTSTFRIPSVTEHVETRLWLVEKILGAKCRIHENLITVEGIGFLKKR